ncbi:MAG: hypothetical protein OEO20_11265 [Gemmatimonadota bacterium]|nr:hypothetical protein [Gemmatimonadota bacterium]MDH3367914.1 hypothetical protein [Gemmatimonadota bacterium]MDH3478872.1 hypothetical protein [Gemmatimonadota bacterium]MDH3570296.1 hypothetical protein [Gemmatimonadota bacterium]
MTAPSMIQQMMARGRGQKPRTFRGAKGDLTGTALDEIERSRGLGAEAESEFFKRALAFDPQQGAEESARGIVAGLTPQLTRNLEFARGQAAGTGRLETGFFDVDRGRLFEDFNDRVASAVAANALQAQGLQQRGIESIGAFGQNVQNRFVNLLGGSLDRAQAEENAAKGGGLFGKLIGGAAGLVGGPIAGAAGNWLADKAFPGGD